MKKIWLFILLVIPFTNVFAISTYYSDYKDYKLGTSEQLEISDILKKEEYKVYNTMITDIQDQGYVSEDVCENKYLNDSRITYNIIPRSNNNKTWYTSIDIPDGIITHILLYNVKYATVSEVYIYDGNKLTDVTLQYSDSGLDSLVDDDINTKIRIVPNQNIDFIIPKINSKNFKMKFLSDNKISGTLYFTYEDGRVEQRTILSDEVDVVSSAYLEEIKPIVGVFMGNGQVGSYEKEENVLYHCYKNNTYITNEYKENVSGINETLILDDYKTLYNYYIRDKAKISDKKITSNKITLKELVTYSTIDLDNLRIDGEVDYTKNGTYSVKYIFNDDFIVNKDIVINIAKNDKIIEPTTTKLTSTTTTTSKPSTSTTKKSTSIKTSTTRKYTTTTTSMVSNITTSAKVSSTTSKIKTTTKAVKPNDTCPTYNQYEDEEVLEVEPLKATIEEDNKIDKYKVFKIVLIIITIILVIIYIILRIIDNKKDTL